MVGIMVFCREYCGTQHSKMAAVLKVVPKEEFEKWLYQGTQSSQESNKENLYRRRATMAAVGYKPYFSAGLIEWIITTDHIKIGIMYGITSRIFFLIAGLSALAIRLELFQPGLQYMSEDGVM